MAHKRLLSFRPIRLDLVAISATVGIRFIKASPSLSISLYSVYKARPTATCRWMRRRRGPEWAEAVKDCEAGSIIISSKAHTDRGTPRTYQSVRTYTYIKAD